jgi:hypothetical protein
MLVIVAVSAFLLTPSILVLPLFEVPIGNLLAVVGLFSASAVPLTFPSRPLVLKVLSILSCLVALAWLPTGVLLSGNLWLNFVNDAQDSYHFLLLTNVSIFLAVSCLILPWLANWLMNGKHKR